MTTECTTNLSKNAVDFINDAALEALLEEAPPTREEVKDAIAKGMNKEALSVEETATLLRATDPEQVEEIFEAARELKRRVYGNRIVLFAPLYIGSRCINDCTYCGFKRSNPDAVRRSLTEDEIRSQVTALENEGHKRLILVFGEHAHYTPEFMAKAVKCVYETKSGHGEIRRVNINAAPLSIEGFQTMKEAEIGTYQIFQETYHHKTYREAHAIDTPKGDFLYRLDGLNRAMEAGCDDVGIGALFGLHSDWRFDVLGLVQHALFLQARYGVGPHTISFPRLQPASGVEIDESRLVNDYDFKRLVATLRLAVPYTGLILTARESPELRKEVMDFGVSQIDAGTRLEVGGYTEAGDAQTMEREQFKLGDIRSLDTVVRELIESGHLPSNCTACYRLGRTGEHFMEFAIPGFIKRFCTPNALTTLQEYLCDYASPETRAAGAKLIAKELDEMPESSMKEKLVEKLDTIFTTEERDLYF